MLVISRSLVEAMVAHARRDHPHEACGILAGPTGSDRPRRHVAMPNAARSPTSYAVDPADLLALYLDLEARAEDPVVIYHSHTATAAYPSSTDVAYASEPAAHYVVVSTRSVVEEVRSFRIVDGRVSGEHVRVVRSRPYPRAPWRTLRSASSTRASGG